MMTVAESFPPLVGDNAKTLILGSMPGKASLAAGRYYAHPQNAFWPIMAALFGFNPEISYEQRIAVLEKAGIALWDVLRYCVRESSMDADIVEASIIPNDIVGFLQRYAQIRTIYFNGSKAEQSFHRYLRPAMEHAGIELTVTRLPSTSPANARMNFAEKLWLWRQILA